MALIHRDTQRHDDGRVQELRLASRKDIRNGILILALLSCLSLALYGVARRPGLLIWAGLFWGVILVIRGFRLRREAWQLENLGFIDRERNQAQ